MWQTLLLMSLLSTQAKTFGTTLRSLSLSVTPKCSQLLDDLFANFSTNQPSKALQMFTASSKVPSSPLYLKYGDLGDFDQCITSTGKYCLGYISVSSQNVEQAKQVPTWALCMPDSCTTDDMNVIGNALFRNLEGVTVKFADILCQTITDTRPLVSSGAIGAMVVLAALTLTVLGSTIFDIYSEFYRSNLCPRIVKAFSAYSNGKQIFTMSTAPEQLPCLNGLKCITMVWVVAHHQFSILKYGSTVNPTQMLGWYDNLRSMFIVSGHISVDTFLVIGGTLMSYGFMKARSRNISFNLFQYYLHRYLRLIAPLILVVLFSATLLKYMGSGPKWPFLVTYFQTNCENYWWSALLFVQNYVNTSQMCVGQTWYLDIDMQLCILSPPVFWAMWKYPKWSLPVLGVGTVVLTGVPFYIAWMYDLPAIVSNFYSTHSTDYQNRYYLLTHTRCVPWILGTFLGYFLYVIKKKSVHFKLKKTTAFVAWIVTLAVFLTCVLSGHGTLRNSEYDRWGNSLHITLVRPAWSLAVMWIILACSTGYAGPIGWVLSFSIYQVLNRFTYSVYLTHVTLLYGIAYSRKWPDFFSDFNMAYQFWGTLGFSGGMAVLLVFIAECPVAAIEKVLLDARRRSSRKSDVENGVANRGFEK